MPEKYTVEVSEDLDPADIVSPILRYVTAHQLLHRVAMLKLDRLPLPGGGVGSQTRSSSLPTSSCSTSTTNAPDGLSEALTDSDRRPPPHHEHEEGVDSRGFRCGAGFGCAYVASSRSLSRFRLGATLVRPVPDAMTARSFSLRG